MNINLEHIHSVLRLIEDHHNTPISIKDLERVSHYSYRNIQRIFKYTCGETIGEYQKRLKIENAYKFILYTNESLSWIALEVGFDNIASFSKAFKQYFGISPKEARLNKPVLFQKNAIVPLPSDAILTPEILYLPTLKVFYQSAKTHYLNDDIEALWATFMTHDFPEKGTTYYGVVVDEPLITNKIKCRYDACSSVQSPHKTLPSKTIFGGKYAKFLHHGSYETLDATYTKIYARWILTTQLAFSPSPIIEQYIKHDSNTKNEVDFLTAILIPLQT